MHMAAALAELDRAFRALIVEWERYFSGDRKVPPIGDRERFARRLGVLTGREARGAEAFRREQLQHRFTSYSQMWERQLRQREEGRVAGGYIQGAPRSAPNAEAAASVESGGDEGLWNRYVIEKERLGQEVTMGREAFLEQLNRQREELEARFGCTVRFQVQVEGGRVKVAARATQPPPEGE